MLRSNPPEVAAAEACFRTGIEWKGKKKLCIVICKAFFMPFFLTQQAFAHL